METKNWGICCEVVSTVYDRSCYPRIPKVVLSPKQVLLHNGNASSHVSGDGGALTRLLMKSCMQLMASERGKLGFSLKGCQPQVVTPKHIYI